MSQELQAAGLTLSIIREERTLNAYCFPSLSLFVQSRIATRKVHSLDWAFVQPLSMQFRWPTMAYPEYHLLDDFVKLIIVTIMKVSTFQMKCLINSTTSILVANFG